MKLASFLGGCLYLVTAQINADVEWNEQPSIAYTSGALFIGSDGTPLDMDHILLVRGTEVVFDTSQTALGWTTRVQLRDRDALIKALVEYHKATK